VSVFNLINKHVHKENRATRHQMDSGHSYQHHIFVSLLPDIPIAGGVKLPFFIVNNKGLLAN